MTMQLDDYLLPQEGHDWGTLLAPWQPLLASRFEVWLVNRIGDVVMVFDDGSVHFLNTGDGTVSRVADSRNAFAGLLDRDDNADNWLAIQLIDALVAAGLRLGPGQCYGFIQPPLLGGDYTPENVRPLPVKEVFGVLGEVYRQTEDLPDGIEVRFGVTD